MPALIRAELLKLRTVRTVWWYVLATLAFVPSSVALAVDRAGSAGFAPLDSADGVRAVFAASSSGGVVVILLGIMLMAGEFRFQTATATFLVTPDRRRVLAAKLAASSVVGALLGVACSLLSVLIAIPVLEDRGADVAAHTGSVAGVLVGGIMATAVSGLVGVGLGALLRNQTLAIVVSLVWLLVLEGMLISFTPQVGRWLPGGAASALSGADTGAGRLLPAWGAAALFAAYGVAFAAAGSRLVLTRDVA
jgi:ABC-2 type transport system permease protein